MFLLNKNSIWLLLGLTALSIVVASVFADGDRSTNTGSVSVSGQSNDAQTKKPDTLLAQSTPSNHATGEKAGIGVPPDANKTVATAAAEPQPTPSQNVTINLIHRLVQRGVLTKEDADELIKQAEDDAARARALAEKQAARVDETAPQLYNEPPPLPQTTTASTTTGPTDVAPDVESSDGEDAVSVSYVPEIVKKQLRDEIREEVMAQAREENWANPRTFPAWVLRFTPFADLRLRYEGIYFPFGNDNLGAFPNFNAINTGPPFDVTGTTFSPQLDVDQNRQRVRIRVRLGAQMDLEDGFTFGIRIATGESNAPTSTNQTLGVANNAQGGNFSKYAIWLDRAFVRYELGGKPSEDFMAEIGRFDNPYFVVGELMWDDDLGWDGFALAARRKVAEGVTPFVVAGVFPVFNTDLNFSTTRPDKFPSENKWLYGIQLGTGLRFNKDFSAKIATGYYDFYNIEGKLSDPFVPLTTSDQGNTDDSRPSFAQKGNTYFPIRDIIPTVDNGFGTTKQYQYFGLVTPFRVVDVTGSLDFAHFEPVHVTLVGEWLQNTAFNYDSINAIAINNRGPDHGDGTLGDFAGGNTGWMAGLKIGHPLLAKRWAWQAGFNYRYIESDATVDAFNDSDFGGGGTNLKGYSVFGALALSPRVAIGLRWLSADQIAGPTYRNDIFQFDFNARF